MREPLPKITKRQKDILLFIYRYRFLTRLHIQILLNHKNPSTINQWLKDLTINHYLVQVPVSPRDKLHDPAIYYIGTTGIPYLKQHENTETNQTKNLYSEHKRKSSFIQHCLALADFACNLVTHMRNQKQEAVFMTRADFTGETDDEILLFLQDLKPDAYYTYNGTGIAQVALIEVIDEYIPTRVLINKIKKYIQASNGTDWQAFDTDRFPSVIFLLHTQKKLRFLQQIIKRVRNEFTDEGANDFRCNLALVSDIKAKSITENI